PDRLGSVRDIVTTSGGQNHLDYDGFGNVVVETNPVLGDRYRWTSREYDAETGWQYHRARYYDPATGRWTSEDPIGFAAGDANLYDPPPAYPGKGRPRVKGRQRAKPKAAVARARRRQRLQVGWYGGGTRRVEVVTGTGHWYKAGWGLVPVR
ncbi:MAG TPA: RHS repeat-associated core domain-containing protein, partial [Gemmataceae bacterium]|nr:RHS repeat-associated core domain-containing protein [Gemmataceae bacterium]